MKNVKLFSRLFFILVFTGIGIAGGFFSQAAWCQDEMIEFYEDRLRDEDSNVRFDAAENLAEMDNEEALEILIDTLDSRSKVGRWEAAYGLGEMRNPEGIKPLIDALKDDDPYVVGAAAFALKKVTSEDFGRDYAQWQSWWLENKERLLQE